MSPFPPETQKMSAGFCQDFVQNAWKRDLCSNCFKTRADHGIAVANNNDNNNNNNSESTQVNNNRENKKSAVTGYRPLDRFQGFRKAGVVDNKWMPNHSSTTATAATTANNHSTLATATAVTSDDSEEGVPLNSGGSAGGATKLKLTDLPNRQDTTGKFLLQVGSSDERPIQNGRRASVGILRISGGSTVLNGGGGGAAAPRRASVGFLEGSPIIIGYGGDDHHSSGASDDDDDDEDGGSGDDSVVRHQEEEEPEEEDEPSDADSLENYEDDEEDPEFKNLTVKNTEFNSETKNLLVSPLIPKKKPLTVASPAPAPAPAPPAVTRAEDCTNVRSPSDLQQQQQQQLTQNPALVNGTVNGKQPPQRLFQKADSRGLLRARYRSDASGAASSKNELLLENGITAAGTATTTTEHPHHVGNHYNHHHLSDDDQEEEEGATTELESSLEVQQDSRGNSFASDDSTTTTTEKQQLNSNCLALNSSNSDDNNNADEVDDEDRPPPLPTTPPPPLTSLNPPPSDTDDVGVNVVLVDVKPSCHYASTSVLPKVPGVGVGGGLPLHNHNYKRTVTNPYSSTSILHGLPSDSGNINHTNNINSTYNCNSNNNNKNVKPPVTKPKPKIPAKPGGIPVSSPVILSSPTDLPFFASPPPLPQSQPQQPTLAHHPTNNTSTFAPVVVTLTPSSCDNNNLKMDDTAESTKYGNSSNDDSNCYQEIAGGDIVEPNNSPHQQQSDYPPVNGGGHDDATNNKRDKAKLSFQNKVSALSTSLDLSKKSAKRQAPAPPPPRTVITHHVIQTDQSSSHYNNSVQSLNATISESSGPPMPHTAGQGGPSAAHFASSRNNTRTQSLGNLYSISKQHPLLTCTVSSPGFVDCTDVNSSSSSVSSYNVTPVPPIKEVRTKKNRFSLKKLLRRSKDNLAEDTKQPKSDAHYYFHHHAENGHGHSSSSSYAPRRPRPEILHPIDLMQREGEMNGGGGGAKPLSTSSPVSSMSSTPTSSMPPSPSKIPILPHTSTPNDSSLDSSSELVSPKKQMRPPPPPRTKPSHQDGSPKASDGTTAKPQRPPPPTTKPCIINSNISNTSIEESKQPPHNETEDELDNRRLSYVSLSSTYANLGDIRNEFVPSKPGRYSNSLEDSDPSQRPSPTSSLCSPSTDTVPQEQDYSYSFTPEEAEDSSYHLNVIKDEDFVTPLSSPEDSGSQSSLVIHSVNEENANNNRDSLNSSLSTSSANNNPRPMSLPADDSGSRVYERVVVKRGNVEKIYWKPASVVTGLTGPEFNATDAASEDGDVVGTGMFSWSRKKPARLSLRKGKTIVYRNLEDNYGAVVNANHQALSQILEQVASGSKCASRLALLQDLPLQWHEFSLLEDSQVKISKSKVFYTALWRNSVEVTVMISDEATALPAAAKGRCFLNPVTKFEDFIPETLFTTEVRNIASDNVEMKRASVWVLEPMHIERLTTYIRNVKEKTMAQQSHLENNDDLERTACFLLVQFIHGLKHLQSLGIEELNVDHPDFLVVSEASENQPGRLIILPEFIESETMKTPSSKTKRSLCQCALSVLQILLPECKDDFYKYSKTLSETLQVTLRLVKETLGQEKAASLSHSKLLLECFLWGPLDLVFGSSDDVTEQAFQRWLDLERATALNALIHTQSLLQQMNIGINEEFMLIFLVRTCAKTLGDAATLIAKGSSQSCA